jgi:hypothetical protein
MHPIENRHQAGSAPGDCVDTLTSLEHDIAALVAAGLTDAEIAGRSRLRLAVWAAGR